MIKTARFCAFVYSRFPLQPTARFFANLSENEFNARKEFQALESKHSLAANVMSATDHERLHSLFACLSNSIKTSADQLINMSLFFQRHKIEKTTAELADLILAYW